MDNKIGILLVDDHQVVLDGLQGMLEQEADFCVVGQSKTAESTLSCIDRLSPDVVLMDIKMPDVDGIELARQVLQQHNDCNIIMLTLYDEFLPQALGAGAKGYLLKDIKSRELFEAIRMVYAGQVVVSESIRKVAQLEIEHTMATRTDETTDNLVEELQLVLSPPVEANQLLRLAGRTEETLQSRVLQMVGAWEEGTIMTVILNSRTELQQVIEDLRGIPEIQSVTEKPTNETISVKLLKKMESMPSTFNRPRRTIFIDLAPH